MRKEIGVDDDAHLYEVIEVATGNIIHDCVMADDEKGVYKQYIRGVNGDIICDSLTKECMPVMKFGKIKLQLKAE